MFWFFVVVEGLMLFCVLVLGCFLGMYMFCIEMLMVLILSFVISLMFL